MPQPIRFKEATPQLTVNGVRQRWISNLVEGTINIDAEITSRNYAGEPRSRKDIDVDGVSGDLSVHVDDRGWWEAWELTELAEANGDPLPTLSLSLTFNYRGRPRHTLVIFDELILKPNQLNIANKDYVTVPWSFGARRIAGV